MANTHLPTFRLLQHGNFAQDQAHSMLIALLRGLAAIEVAAAHLRAHVFPGLRSVADPSLAFQALAFFTGFAHQAVVIFFVLSGWLVGGSLLNKLNDPRAIESYAIDRMTRLWIVLIPVFLLTLLFALFTENVHPAAAGFELANEYSFASFIGNLLGLQTMAVLPFGGNFPLWSLANETWYYVLFPLLAIGWRGPAPATRIGAALLALLVMVSVAPAITLYFSIWLLGAACSRIRIDAGRAARVLFFVIFAALAVYFRLRGNNDDMNSDAFLQDLVYSIAFLLFLGSMQFKLPPAPVWHRLQRVGEVLSSFSFTLYVLHIPLLVTLVHLAAPMVRKGSLAPNDPVDWLVYFGLLFAIILSAYLVHLPFEAQTHRLRRQIKRWLLGTPAPVVPLPNARGAN